MKNALLTIVTLIFGVLLAEIALKTAAFISPRVAYELAPPWSNRALEVDPKLGYRVSSFYPGSDRRGYRNPEATDVTDILAIGDSMTFGYTVTEKNSWPSVIRNKSNIDIYNAGVGGYGPCEYLEVTKELTHLNPTLVVVALYLGNDMSDAYTSVYLENRCTELLSENAKVLDEITHLHSEKSLSDEAHELGLEPVPEFIAGNLPGRTYESSLRDKSSVYSLVRTVYHLTSNFKHGRFGEGIDEQFVSASESSKHGTIHFDDNAERRTVFKTPAVDILAVDQADLRISEGRRITEAALIEIKSLIAEANNAGLVVAIIPTKAVVYQNILGKAVLDQNPTLSRKMVLENELKQDLVSFLEEHSIVHVDTTPLLVDAITNKNIPLFHQSSNEHPNEQGYNVIASAIAATLKNSTVSISEGIRREY